MSKNKCFCDQLVSGFPFIRDIAIGTTTGTRVVECTYSPVRKVYEERGRPKRRRIRFLRFAVPVAVPPRCPGWVVIRKRKVKVLTRFTIHWWRFRHIGGRSSDWIPINSEIWTEGRTKGLSQSAHVSSRSESVSPRNNCELPPDNGRSRCRLDAFTNRSQRTQLFIAHIKAMNVK